MEINIRAQPGPQEQFCASSADICVYGGAAGGGKTWALLFEAARFTNVRGYGALLFRKSYTQIRQQGGMWDESQKLYRYWGGYGALGRMSWSFPAGSRIGFGYLDSEDDKFKYDGAQITMVGFDQLEQNTESQFFYLLARNRSLCGVNPYIRATCNPEPDSWLSKFLDWWIAEDGYPDPKRAGRTRYFVRERTRW